MNDTITHKREEGMGISSSDGLPNFQLLLDQYKGSLMFKRLITTKTVSPDEHLYKIETNDGIYYVFEVDFIEDFDEITDFIKINVGEYTSFVEVKQPPEKFEDTSPFKVSSLYPEPLDFVKFKKYVNDTYGSYNGYFNFLIKI